MQLERIGARSAIRIMQKELCIPEVGIPEVSGVAVVAEYLRMVMVQFAIADDDPGWVKPLYVRRALLSVTQQLEPIWPELGLGLRRSTTEDSGQRGTAARAIRRVLQYLERIGDVVHLGGGWWIPAPVRKVPLPNSRAYLLVGGLATVHLRATGFDVVTHGVGRLANVVDGANFPEQSFDSWVGWVPEDLGEFTQTLLDEARANASPSASGFTEYEVFISNRLRFRLKTSWVHASQVSPTELEQIMLCRTTGPQRFFLGEFQNGRLSREYPVDDVETVKWLQLGLCKLHGLETPAIWDGSWLRVFGVLPIAVERQVLAVACPHMFYRGTYWVPRAFRPIVSELLSNNGYRVRW